MNFVKQQLYAMNLNNNIYCKAPAGSGKTTVLINRIIRLVKERCYKSKEILVLVFNRAVSIEISQKISELTSIDLSEVTIQTMHAYCRRELKKSDIRVKLITNKAKRKVISEAYLNIEFKKIYNDEYENIANQISYYKNTGINKLSNIVQSIYNIYEDYKKNKYLIDFDDMFLLYQKYIDDNKIKVNSRFKYLMIDEFQDFNLIQYKIVGQFKHSITGIYATGDKKQGIYQFRGSNSKYINMFINDWNAEVIELDTTFRCSQDVMEKANIIAELIDGNIAKTIHNNGDFRAVYEMDFDKIKSNTTILVKTNKEVYRILMDLFKNSIFFKLPKGIPFTYTQQMILGIMMSFAGMKNSLVTKYNYLKKSKFYSKDLDVIKNATTIDGLFKIQTDSNFNFLIDLIANIQKDDDYLNKLMDSFTNATITVGTLHSYKGMENDNIILVLSDNFPDKRELFENELNLFYVGLTRAKKDLTIVCNSINNRLIKLLKEK